MKFSITTYGKDDQRYQDVNRFQFGINCPYAIKLKIGRICATLYRWNCLTICIGKAMHEPEQGGAMEDWAEWVLWQDKPFGRFQFWKQSMPHGRNSIRRLKRNLPHA